MRLPHPIAYQGSKRNLAGQILRFFPERFDKLIEPFAGSAAITIAAASRCRGRQFVINDINTPLSRLWEQIINNPEQTADAYHNIWHGQVGREEEYYYEIRDRFNESQKPEYLLFLLAKCVKAAVRYNAQGYFNQSPDKRRLGRNPKMMRDDILRASRLLIGRASIFSEDYAKILDLANENDLVYLDPPYQGTGLNGGFSYSGSISIDSFLISLRKLNDRKVPFILSYDGRTGSKTFGVPLPENLDLMKIEVIAGRSSQATLLRRNETTFESIYLSKYLLDRIDSTEIKGHCAVQTEMFAANEKI